MAIITSTSNVTIQTGKVEIGDYESKFDSPEEPSLHMDYVITSRYHWDPSRYMIGITSPDGFKGKSVAFFQLSSSTLLWIADWTASMFGLQPPVPDPSPVNEDWVLLDIIPEPGMMSLANDGVTPYYRISGTYIYGHTDPPNDPFDVVVFPKPPWFKDDFERKFQKNKFKRGLIDIQQSSLRGGGEKTPIR